MSVYRNCVAAAVLLLAGVGTVSAFTYVTDANGTWWGIQDAASPGVDTGSIRATQIAAGQTAAFSTSMNGFGGIRVLVDLAPAPRFNGELMRGFGLTFDGVDRFRTTQSVNLGGVTISRAIVINRTANWGRWLDTFTNTTKAPLTIKVAFGGQSGLGASGGNSSALVNTSSGDTKVAPGDAWVEVATPLDTNKPETMVGGPQITVTGSFEFAGNWLHDTFATPLSSTGHEGNFQAYINSITLPPGKSRSLLHFIVLGQRVNVSSSAGVRAAVEATATALAASPELGGLTPGEICTIVNFDTSKPCAATGQKTDVVAQPAPPPAKTARTSARYNVFEKTIGQLRADLETGITTSQEITRAYLDRIEVYDKGQFGFHAYEIVAADLMAQARAADAARKAGRRGPLLGIPIAVKNNYDSKDMATTNGSMTFENFRPAQDAFQVARLREAGAVLIGKTALEEYATSGFYSNDAWGQVWNVFNPSKSALGSSGGSASAVAGSLAAAALGSQTGDSLYAPASAQSLVTLRGTDGLQSGSGIMPLTWMMDYGGAMTRSVADLADMLNVLAVPDPQDPATLRRPNGAVPVDWRTVLNANALRGKRIGYIPSVWVDPFGSTNTIDASKAALKFLQAAGATIVEMGVTVGDSGDAPPNVPAPSFEGGSIGSEGWRHYIDSHPELRTQGFQILTEVDVRCSQKKVAYVRTAPEDCAAKPSRRLTAAEIQAHRDYRQITRPEGLDKWMDEAGADNLGVDAIVYPGLLSDVSLNDGGGARAAFGRRDTPSAATGSPTIVMPAGVGTHGQPINIQLLGRAWDDAKLVGFAYAFEQIANAAGRGHVAPATVPALSYDPAISPGPAIDAGQTGGQSVQYRSPDGVEYRSLPDTDAVRNARAALEADPKNISLIIDLGVAQSGARQFREAIATFTRGLEIAPNHALLLRWRGHRYLSLRDFDRAFADLTRGAGIDSTIYGIWYHLGVIQYLRGDFADAAASFAKAQPIAPDAGELAGSTDWLWMSLSRAGRGAEAKAMLDRRPDSKPVANAYTRRLQLYRGEIGPEAVLTPADTDDVQVATLAYGLGNWYLLRGDNAQARAWFERSIQSGGWPAFGFIVSEVELRRLR